MIARSVLRPVRNSDHPNLAVGQNPSALEAIQSIDSSDDELDLEISRNNSLWRKKQRRAAAAPSRRRWRSRYLRRPLHSARSAACSALMTAPSTAAHTSRVFEVP